MTRHQTWLLTLTATIATATLTPQHPTTMLTTTVPALWIMAYIAHRCDILTRQYATAEQHITEQIDIAVADAVLNCRHHNRPQPDYPALRLT